MAKKIKPRPGIDIRTARAALRALDDAAGWIAEGEIGIATRKESWFHIVPSFDRRRRALRRAIARAEGAPKKT